MTLQMTSLRGPRATRDQIPMHGHAHRHGPSTAGHAVTPESHLSVRLLLTKSDGDPDVRIDQHGI